MARKGENNYKRKDGRWEGRYVIGKNGSKTIYGYVYAASYSEVREKLNSKKFQYQSNKWSVLDKDGSFSVIAEDWLADHQSHIKPSSYNKYRMIVQNYLIPLLGGISISSIDSARVNQLCRSLASQDGLIPRKLSEKTTVDTLNILKQILNYAALNKYAIDHSALLISLHQKKSNIRILTRFEEAKIIEYILNDLTTINLGILLCMFTGIRLGEICALQWENIDLENAIIRITQSMQRVQTSKGVFKTEVIIQSPKSSSSTREIPLTASIIRYLKPEPNPKSFFYLLGKTVLLNQERCRDIFIALWTPCRSPMYGFIR